MKRTATKNLYEQPNASSANTVQNPAFQHDYEDHIKPGLGGTPSPTTSSGEIVFRKIANIIIINYRTWYSHKLAAPKSQASS